MSSRYTALLSNIFRTEELEFAYLQMVKIIILQLIMCALAMDFSNMITFLL